ncbi:hypothetical protein, partial [Holdemania massiliensis]|uniref:hypothetical protein n=1 Tax=Holdemania massiliensis TaxID=1468449 RepID=UPI0019D66414
SLVLFVLPHYERVKSTRIRWKSDFHLPRPEVELNFSIEQSDFPQEQIVQELTLETGVDMIRLSTSFDICGRRKKLP